VYDEESTKYNLSILHTSVEGVSNEDSLVFIVQEVYLRLKSPERALKRGKLGVGLCYMNLVGDR